MIVSMGRTALFCVIWMVLNTPTGSITATASTLNHTASNHVSVLTLSVSTVVFPVQSHSPPITFASPLIKEAANVSLVTHVQYSSPITTTIQHVTTTTVVSIIYTRTYYLTLLPSPSTINYQCATTAATQCASESGTMACNMKQANTAAGVVGGLIGGSIFGSVLTVVITAVAAILITKHHKKGNRCHRSRYL